MPQTCSICKHASRGEVDQALLSGEAYRNVARRFEASESAVFRHSKDHISQTPVRANGAAEAVQPDTLLERLRDIHRETSANLKSARESQNHTGALQAARLLGQVSDSAKMLLSDEEFDLFEGLIGEGHGGAAMKVNGDLIE